MTSPRRPISFHLMPPSTCSGRNRTGTSIGNAPFGRHTAPAGDPGKDVRQAIWRLARQPFPEMRVHRRVTVEPLVDEGEPDCSSNESEARFAELYRTDHDRLVRLAALILGSTSAAEDVVQECFAKAYQRFATLQSPGAWLRVAVVNGCRNEHRRVRVVQRYVASRSGSGRSEPQELRELTDSLRRLPARQRTVVVLRFYEDLPEQEIAEVMGVSVGTVKSTLSRALARLRLEVER